MKIVIAVLLAIFMVGGCAQEKTPEAENEVSVVEETIEQNEPERKIAEENNEYNAEQAFAGGEDEETEYHYIGNINSMKFHLDSCVNLPKAENRVLFENRDEALSEGYTPCRNCRP